jgi:hypothetical protein
MVANIKNIVDRNENEITVFYIILEGTKVITEESRHFPNTVTILEIRQEINNRLEQLKNRPQYSYDELIGEVIE